MRASPHPPSSPAGPLTWAELLDGYSAGLFLWPFRPEERNWFLPEDRTLMPIEGMRVSRSLARTVRKGRYEIRFDTDLPGVLAGCARPEGTWITPGDRRDVLLPVGARWSGETRRRGDARRSSPGSHPPHHPRPATRDPHVGARGVHCAEAWDAHGLAGRGLRPGSGGVLLRRIHVPPPGRASRHRRGEARPRRAHRAVPRPRLHRSSTPSSPPSTCSPSGRSRSRLPSSSAAPSAPSPATHHWSAQATGTPSYAAVQAFSERYGCAIFLT